MTGDLSYADLYPGRFLRSMDLKGKAITVTISNVYLEELEDKKAKGGKKKKPILAFMGKKLELVLVKTNGECIRAMFGENIRDWMGKRITIYPTECLAYGEMKPCIRIMGSPDLSDDLVAQLNLGQQSRRWKLKKTKGGPPVAAPPPEPEPQVEEATAEETADFLNEPSAEEQAEIHAQEEAADIPL